MSRADTKSALQLALTPLSTVGPFFKLLLRDREEGRATLVADRTRGERITIQGRLLDGAGAPVDDGLIEIWQADADGRYRHPWDPRSPLADPFFSGFGRLATGTPGTFEIHTIKPGRVPSVPAYAPGEPIAISEPRPAGEELREAAGRLQAPHMLVSAMARGIMTRCWTRIYFEDEPSNAEDPILALVPPDRRHTLIARAIDRGRYQFDIVIQGESETVFFEA